MNYAPIILFVYNRPEHSLQTLTALMQNDLADQSVLYIYADGPKENASQEELKKIEETRGIIKSKQWCKETIIIENEKNKGLANSVISGVTEVVNKHETIIVLEDDIVTTIQFLKFMNGALAYYENEKRVFGISGFTYPAQKPLTGTHCLPIACSWSWATWQSRWNQINFDAGHLKEEIEKRKLIKQFDFGFYPFYKMLQDQLSGVVNSWAIRFYASMFLAKGLFIYPQKSLVSNNGFDGSASHTQGSDNFFDKVSGEKIEIHYVKPILDNNLESIRLKFAEQFNVSKINKRTKVTRLGKAIYNRFKRIIN